jgi:hypothetical protein
MDEFDIPIFKKAYMLYKDFYGIRSSVSKQDRYTIYLRCENAILDVIEAILKAGRENKIEKLPTLELASTKLNLLRMLIRMLKDVKAINIKNYSIFEEKIDEIGRMLGGWIKSTKEA